MMINTSKPVVLVIPGNIIKTKLKKNGDKVASLDVKSPKSCYESAGDEEEEVLRPEQPPNLLIERLPEHIVLQVFQHVDQFDLVNLSLTCSKLYPIAVERLYQRVTVVLSGEFAKEYQSDSRQFIRENGIKHMDSSLIFKIPNLIKFFKSLHKNTKLIQLVKFFIFDKCYPYLNDINQFQSDLIEFFGKYLHEMNFLHITFIDFLSGINKLTNFLKNSNIRNKIFKLFVTDLPSLYEPKVPKGLTNLFLMLKEEEILEILEIDLSTEPFNLFNSLFTLTCSTNNQFGLEILKKFQLFKDLKLNLKGLTIFHCHKESLIDDNFISYDVKNDDVISKIDKKLEFDIIEEKIELKKLNHIYLKIDCFEHRINNCNCFEKFFKKFNHFVAKNDGLSNLTSFDIELYPNYEWLRPHLMCEYILNPLGEYIKNLKNLERLTLDFSTPAFKMFDNGIEMSSILLNKLNERLIESFFQNFKNCDFNLKTLQLPDFLTSFIYYKPDFYQLFLHTCQCYGCQLVLDRLKQDFYPLNDIDEDSNDLDLESTYYILIGFILGKLQADREVCVPIKQKTFNYKNYPIFKGQPHTLHYNYHNKNSCHCELENDPLGLKVDNIDNLVTIYIIHQLNPFVDYLSTIFTNLDNLMIHGIYYEYNSESKGLTPIFDRADYPNHFLDSNLTCTKSDLPFAYFR